MSDVNPFPAGDRHDIWEMLVRRDIEAYVARNWDAHYKDFAPDSFFGIDGGFSDNPDLWRVRFADIAVYRQAWLDGAHEMDGRITDAELQSFAFRPHDPRRHRHLGRLRPRA